MLGPATDADVTEASSEADDRQVTVSAVSVNTANSIAVLPFDAMSNVPEDKYFADGLSEEIRYSLSQLPELRVIASASSSAFKDKGTPIPLLAQALKVTYVLDGSVRKENQQVRITAQLIDARSDSHVWSVAYDRSLADTIAIQREIADQVVEHLRAALGTGEREAIARIPRQTENQNGCRP